MRFGRRKPPAHAAPPPTNDREFREWLGGAADEARAKVVSDLVLAITPFGRLDDAVVSDADFARLTAGVMTALAEGDADAAQAIAVEIEASPALQLEEEPAGVGFFALGALVEVLYAARFVAGDGPSAVQAVARAVDVVGFADDDLGTKHMTSLVSGLCAFAAGRADEAVPADVAGALADQALRLTGR